MRVSAASSSVRGEASGRVVEARRQPDRAVRHCVAQHAAHVVDRPLVRRDVVPAERVDAQLAVADERADIEADGAVIPSEVVGDGAPVVVDVRTAVEPGVEVHERIEILLPPERREAIAVDTDDLGGDSLADLGFVERLGEDHEAAVAVQIDEAGRDDPSARVDRRAGVLRSVVARVEEADPIAFDDHSPSSARRTGPIDDRPAGDQKVDAVRHVADDTSLRPW